MAHSPWTGTDNISSAQEVIPTDSDTEEGLTGVICHPRNEYTKGSSPRGPASPPKDTGGNVSGQACPW